MAARKSGNDSQEVARTFPVIPAETLAEIQTYEDALNAARHFYGEENLALAADVLGDGFRMLENKDTLIGVKFFAISWNFTTGDHGEYVAVRGINVANGEKFVITDGSRGIYAMLAHYSKQTGRYGGLMCAKGLRRSDYEYTDEKTGEVKPAHTHYLDVSS